MRLIDADALILKRRFMVATDWSGDHDGYAVLVKDIYDAPTIDARPVAHGRWIHPKGYVVSNGFLCSECGHEEASHWAINRHPGGFYIADDNGNFFYPPKIKYCHNCGAKMDGGETND